MSQEKNKKGDIEGLKTLHVMELGMLKDHACIQGGSKKQKGYFEELMVPPDSKEAKTECWQVEKGVGKVMGQKKIAIKGNKEDLIKFSQKRHHE